jgi:hypothetical protein
MYALKRLVPAASLAAIAILSACGDSTSPTAVDPIVMHGALDATLTTFQSNPAYQSLLLLSDQLPPLAAAAVRPLLLSQPRNLAVLARRFPALASMMRASLASPQALFPANILGKTMVWDTLTDTYVVGAQAGAPANGMRLLLYFVDPATATPFRPLQVVGYLELTDKSTPQADRIGVALAIVTTTVASYDITVVTNTDGGSSRATGHFLDGTAANRVDFDFNEVFTETAGTLTNDLTAADGGHIRVSVGVSFVTAQLSIATLVERDHAGLEIDAGVDLQDTNATLTGAVKYNGATVGSLSGTGDAPVVTGTGGHALSAGESAAVLAIFVGALTIVNDVGTAVFAPENMIFHGTPIP